MRLASIIGLALGLAACGGGATPPTAPTSAATPAAPVPNPPPPAPPTPLTGPGVLWVMVFPGNSGSCLPGAAVEVIVSGTVVQRGTQITPCDYWDDGGGILFSNLPLAEVTLRASAAGYVTAEIKVTPFTYYYQVTPIGLQRATVMQQGAN